MTREELKKEAEEKANKVIIGSGMDRASVIHLKHLLTTFYIQGYHTGAEPREKRIAELEDKLANADYQLEGRDNEIAELEAQIEKMKCCVVSCCEGCERLPKLYKEFENGNKEM